MPTEVKQKIKKLRFVINVRNYIRTKKILSGRTGQIKLQSPRGSLIYDFIIKNDIENVLDIGTWNGLGSTTILYNALKVKKKPFRLLSIETDKIAYKNAKKNLKDKSEKGIWLVGGGTLITSFLNLGAIDEMTLSIIPVILGKGIRLFPNEPKEAQFKLQTNEVFKTGVVNLVYTKMEAE